MADFGYDISDYCDVDARFGTLADFDALLADAHRLGLKLILDYVPNHTSDRHPWFWAARSSRDNPYRGYYIWHEPAPGGGPPNNRLSELGGSAWQWEPATGQYYYHAYLRQQPDLNYRNPRVRAALLQVLEFWLERGRPEVHAAIADMRGVVDKYPDRVLIGEAWLPVDRLMAYYGTELSGLHLPFNFQLVNARWEASVIATLARRERGIYARHAVATARGRLRPHQRRGRTERSEFDVVALSRSAGAAAP